MDAIDAVRCTSLSLICTLAVGCGVSPQSTVGKLESENRRLAEQSRAQLAEIENLKVHAHTVEDKLLGAEEELAAMDDISAVDRKKLALLNRERERLRGHLLGGSGGVPSGVSGQLARLAQRYPSLYFDPQTGIAKIDTDVLFDTGDDGLKPAAEGMLRDFAQAMQSPEAADLNIMVVGHTDDQRIAGRETRHRFPSNWHLSAARALAVAGKLRTAGIVEQRMGVAGFGPHQPVAANADYQTRSQNRRVEIFVLGPDVPVVGMTETMTNLY